MSQETNLTQYAGQRPNPVHPDVLAYCNAHTGTPEQMARWIEGFEGFSDEKQHEMVRAHMLMKLEQLEKSVLEILKPTWWERILSRLGL